MAEFVIDNPKASDQLVIGQAYYVDFTPVPPAQPPALAKSNAVHMSSKLTGIGWAIDVAWSARLIRHHRHALPVM